MRAIVRAYRNWYYGRQFVKKGKKFRFAGQYMEIDGHVEIGNGCRFRNNVVLRTTNEGRIIFGDRSGASYNVIIEATKLVRVGRYTGIAENTVIRDTNHMLQGTDKPWRYTPHIAAPIIIGEACFIGSGCYIGPGVTIGDGAVITHGSIVTKDVGPLEIWAGSPARKIAHRTEGIPESVLRRNLELIKQFGVKVDRYEWGPKYDDDDSASLPDNGDADENR